MTKIQELVNEVKNRMKRIDMCFLAIQSDPELMKRYLDLVAETGDLRNVNSQIAKCIGRDCESKGVDRNTNPISSIIQSFSELDVEQNT